jgi:dipeptidyl aminopeptidase/acylaminoacyl peptidase
MRKTLTTAVYSLFALFAMQLQADAPAQRLLTVDDINSTRYVSDPRVSPDGAWVAYAVSAADLDSDEYLTHIWMSSWDGERSLQLTASRHGEYSPRWSPDGRYLSFLSTRGGKGNAAQLWLMERAGGEGQAITSFKGDVLEYAWSPDGKRLALIVMDEDPEQNSELDEDKNPAPLVIDRYYFKEDETGYLGSLRQHLYLLDLETRQVDLLTAGPYDETMPAWSPDGSRIAFFSKREADPDRSALTGLYVIDARAGSQPTLLTRFYADTGDSEWMAPPSWRPDGKEIAFGSAHDGKLMYYSRMQVSIVAAGGGEARIVTADTDRNVLMPRWSGDGKWLYALIEEDRNQHLVRLDPASGTWTRMNDGRRNTADFDIGAKHRVVILDSTSDRPDEVFALDRSAQRQLSHQNEAWLDGVRLAQVDEISFTSGDGTQINGFLVKPPGYEQGQQYPTVLRIHGGPVSQYANAFMADWQILAAQGYAVVAANPRGSSGRGEAFATAIWGEWGGKDSDDVLAAVDYAVQAGIADPQRLGLGGWSYGGILTDVVIAKDTRFKAATSGASIGNALAGYGTDMYIREYELELGTPWNNLDAYLLNAYPLLHADRIETPTLFLCGDLDFNVPLLNSEQMYQALRSLGVDTQLIIYPGQYHSLDVPSYLRDRMQRYVDWYGKYLK